MQTVWLAKRSRFMLLASLCATAGFLAQPAPACAQAAPMPSAAAIAEPSAKKPVLRPHRKTAPLDKAKLDPAPDSATSGNPRIVPFKNSAFPYDGIIPGQNIAFLDKTEPGGRRGHTSPRGGISWEDVTFSDRSTLLYVPKSFDIQKPGLIIVFFHGNQAILRRDVIGRQAVPQQIAESGLNAVLVVPQLAFNALDSSAGHFWDSGFFARFLDEAATRLGDMQGSGAADKFRAMPVVVVAYSGGYLPAIFALETGGAATRVRGVILLDALFGEVDRFSRWIGSHGAATFFFSAFSGSSAEPNAQLRKQAAGAFPNMFSALPPKLEAGTIAFQPAMSATHNDFVTQAWVAHPLKAALSRISGYRTGIQPASAPVAVPLPGKTPVPASSAGLPPFVLPGLAAPRPAEQQTLPPQQLHPDH